MSDTAIARLSGWLYLFVILAGIFAEYFARGSVYLRGDPIGSAEALMASEMAYRWGLTLKAGYLVAYLGAGLILCRLLREGGPLLARFALVLVIAATAVEAANLVVYAVPLYLLSPDAQTAAIPFVERAALAYAALRLFTTGFAIALTFFGTFCFVLGLLIVRSNRFPAWIGWLLGLAGICYGLNSLLIFMNWGLPGQLNGLLMLPCLVGEGAIALWCIVKGVAPASGRTTAD